MVLITDVASQHEMLTTHITYTCMSIVCFFYGSDSLPCHHYFVKVHVPYCQCKQDHILWSSFCEASIINNIKNTRKMIVHVHDSIRPFNSSYHIIHVKLNEKSLPQYHFSAFNKSTKTFYKFVKFLKQNPPHVMYVIHILSITKSGKRTHPPTRIQTKCYSLTDPIAVKYDVMSDSVISRGC